MPNYANPMGAVDDWYNLYNKLIGQAGQGKQKEAYSQYQQVLPWWSWNMFEEQPQSGYGAYTNFMRQGESPAYGSWLQNQYNRYYPEYQSVAAGDPGLMWQDFLQTKNPMNDFGLQSPYDRGERGAGYFSPTMRMTR